MVPEAGPSGPVAVRVCELATKPPTPVAMADSWVMVRFSAPGFTVNPSEPVC